MTDPSPPLNNLIWLIMAGVVLALAGIISAALVYLDLSRRRISGRERFLWLALALILPGLGLGMYFLVRMLNNFLTPAAGREPPLWVTRLKRPVPSSDGGMPAGKGTTIPAVDLLRPQPSSPEYDRGAGGMGVALALVVSAGPDAGGSYSLNRLPLIIGRGSEIDIPLDGDQAVSRRHAELYLQGATLRIRDLDSAHGTTVNGFSIQDKGLEPGDRIEIGRTALMVQTTRRSR